MVNRKIYIPNSEFDKVSLIMSALGYKEVKNKQIFFSSYRICSYSREDDSLQMRSIDKTYLPKSIFPIWVLGIFCLAIIALATIFLIRFLNKGSNYNQMVEFASFMLPAFILVIITTVLIVVRYLASTRNINSYTQINTIKEKVNKIHG